MSFSQYTTKKVEEVFKTLGSRESGLNEKEVKERQKIYGLNEIEARKTKPFDILLRQFKSPFFYLLFIATIIAFLIREISDGIVILLFVLINVFVGFFQEYRAERTVALLKKYIPSTTRVLRDGKEKIIDKRFLVPGDIVFLESGNIVPADLRLLNVQNFLIDESVLTGESAPVPKITEVLSKETKEIFEAKNIAFCGTLIVSGKAKGVVIRTGKEMVLGEIVKLVSGVTRETLYEQNLLKFARVILRTVVTSIIFVFLANLIIRGTENFYDFLIFCIALIVSILPEALPLVVTFALSEGALGLAREKVVIKRLSAVEDLGNIEILCTDKTGTITENKLSLEKIYSQDVEKCLLYSLLASSYIKEEIESTPNPFDFALFEKTPLKVRQQIKNFKEIFEIPFDPFRLRNSVLLKDYNPPSTLPPPLEEGAPEKGGLILIIRGAPETILKLSSKYEGNLTLQDLKEKIETEGRKGKRVLAVAFKKFYKREFSEKDEKDLNFLGYFSFSDPLKATAKESIQLSRKLGVKIKILTGDSKEVAGNIAKEVGLIKDPQKVILGETLDSLSEKDFERACAQFSIFARVSSQTKYKIIETLEKKYAVGFMGEGINDTPALKAAHLAIAVKGATDAAREVSDVVLLENDLRVIIRGIKNGRNIFSNINKYIKCALASNFGNFYSIAVISLFIPYLPMLPIQILLGNLLSDFPLISIATDQVDVEELRKPKAYQISQVILLIISLALVSSIFDLIFFSIFYKIQPPLMRTLWFIESILTEILLIFSIRTRHFFLRTKRPSLPLIALTILDAILIISLPFINFGQKFFHFVALPTSTLLIVFFLVLSYFAISEAVKLVYFSHFKFSK